MIKLFNPQTRLTPTLTPKPPQQIISSTMITSLIIIFLLTTTFLHLTTSTQIPSHISYTHHCPNIPNPPSYNNHLYSHIPSLFSSYVSPSSLPLLGPTSSSPTSNFIPHTFSPTSHPSLFKLDATLSLRSGLRSRAARNLLSVHGGPLTGRTPIRGLLFRVSGYWDSDTGFMCLVGFAYKRLDLGKNSQLDVKFTALYPNLTDIGSSLVVGKLEGLADEGSDGFFETVFIMGFSRMYYHYTLINDVINVEGRDDLSSVGRRSWNCHQISSLANYFVLEGYEGKDCGGRNCSMIDEVVGFSARFMSLNEIDCSGERLVRVGFVVSNVSDVRNGFRQRLDPRRTLVGEGAWEGGKSRLSFVACRLVNFTEKPVMNASIGDCSIRVEFALADRLTVRNSSVIRGRIWSKKSVGEVGYFDSIELRAYGSKRAALPDMKYEYTEIDRAKGFCEEKKASKQKEKDYPDPYSRDMKFDMDVTNGKGKGAWGKARPVYVGDRYVQDIYPYFRRLVVSKPDFAAVGNGSHYGLFNVAYRITFSPRNEFEVGGRSFPSGEKIFMSAEGIYDTESGRLCMVGCWDRETDRHAPKNTTSTLDCDIFINLQFPPQNSNGKDVVKGTIESKRDKSSDPLYFERLDLSGTSLTKGQVADVYWRMDFEITMVLVSNTLACIFVGLQLFHVKRHPDVLPYISVFMLIVITLGHMIPLLLNMEAFFLSTPSKKTVLFGTGGWLEVNEVLVRVITMVAFLLELRLLQLTWMARGTDDSQKATLQESDKKVMYFCLPLYAAGALVAWLVRPLSGQPKLHLNVKSSASLPLWSDVKSCAGFILDTFLLPQILFNIFSDTKESALSIPYYVGTTSVRLLPHGYDLFRAHSSTWSFDPWYIYANPGMNYYSTTWDIIICCVGLVFAVLIFLQQRFGGRRWLLPRRSEKTVAYEMVPLEL